MVPTISGVFAVLAPGRRPSENFGLHAVALG